MDDQRTQDPHTPERALDYPSPQERICSWGLLALGLGAGGVLTAMLMVGGVLGLGAIVFGFVALFEIGHDPLRKGGKGFAWVGIALGIAAVLLSAIVVPSIGRPKSGYGRGMCAANLRGIVQSMAVYASSENDAFPVVPYAPFGATNGGTMVATGVMADMFKPGSPVAGSPLAGPWMLVANGYVATKQFLCRDDPWAKARAGSPDAAGNDYLMFQEDDQISYSFAYPWTPEGKVGEWWKETDDASLPIASDMAPVPGTGKPKRDLAVAGKQNTGSHDGTGQNVAFGDNHVEFERETSVGQRGDNIYTVSGDLKRGSPAGFAPTLAPIRVGGTPGNYDTVMVPERNLDTGKLW